MTTSGTEEQLAAMREELARSEASRVAAEGRVQALEDELEGRVQALEDELALRTPSSPSAVLEQLFSSSTRDAHSAAPTAQRILSHTLSLINGVSGITDRLRAIDERTNAECCASKAAVVVVRSTMHAAVDAKCNELDASLESSRRKLILKTNVPIIATDELLATMNTCRRIASEALQSGDYRGIEAESATLAAVLADGDASLAHLDSATTSLEQGIKLGFISTWVESQTAALNALRAMGGVKARGLSGPLWGLFTADLPADLQRIFRFCAPANANDSKERRRWATALAYFDCALRDRTVFSEPLGAIDGDAAAAATTWLPITEVAAREWCVEAIEAEELVLQFRGEEEATALAGGQGAWKALVAKGGEKLLFTKFDAGQLTISAGGKRVTQRGGGFNWNPAIAGIVLAPNSGEHIWGVEVLSGNSGDIMFGVCAEHASETTRGLHGTTEAAVICGGDGARYGTLGTQTGRNGWHDGNQPNAGDTITLALDTTKGTLTFAKNGRLARGSFANLQGKRVRPFVAMCNGGSVRLMTKGETLHHTYRSICR